MARGLSRFLSGRGGNIRSVEIFREEERVDNLK